MTVINKQLVNYHARPEHLPAVLQRQLIEEMMSRYSLTHEMISERLNNELSPGKIKALLIPVNDRSNNDLTRILSAVLPYKSNISMSCDIGVTVP